MDSSALTNNPMAVPGVQQRQDIIEAYLRDLDIYRHSVETMDEASRLLDDHNIQNLYLQDIMRKYLHDLDVYQRTVDTMDVASRLLAHHELHNLYLQATQTFSAMALPLPSPPKLPDYLLHARPESVIPNIDEDISEDSSDVSTVAQYALDELSRIDVEMADVEDSLEEESDQEGYDQGEPDQEESDREDSLEEQSDQEEADHEDSDHEDSDHEDSDHEDSDHEDSDHEESDEEESDEEESEDEVPSYAVHHNRDAPDIIAAKDLLQIIPVAFHIERTNLRLSLLLRAMRSAVAYICHLHPAAVVAAAAPAPAQTAGQGPPTTTAAVQQTDRQRKAQGTRDYLRRLRAAAGNLRVVVPNGFLDAAEGSAQLRVLLGALAYIRSLTAP